MKIRTVAESAHFTYYIDGQLLVFEEHFFCVIDSQFSPPSLEVHTQFSGEINMKSLLRGMKFQGNFFLALVILTGQ